MATPLENLIAARENIALRIRELTESHNPDVSDQGRSVQLASWLKTLADLDEQITAAAIRAGGPFLIRSRGRAV